MRAVVVGLVGAVLAASSAYAVGGQYQGAGKDPGGLSWNLNARIQPAGSGRYRVNVQSTSASCASEMDGVGILSNQTLRVSGDCDLLIAVRGGSLHITEGASCAAAHGASCEFSGDLRKLE